MHPACPRARAPASPPLVEQSATDTPRDARLEISAPLPLLALPLVVVQLAPVAGREGGADLRDVADPSRGCAE
jgi:hypothetical protein